MMLKAIADVNPHTRMAANKYLIQILRNKLSYFKSLFNA
jgi:hypothetical protein